jgi:hypothetical protein
LSGSRPNAGSPRESMMSLVTPTLNFSMRK